MYVTDEMLKRLQQDFPDTDPKELKRLAAMSSGNTYNDGHVLMVFADGSPELWYKCLVSEIKEKIATGY